MRKNPRWKKGTKPAGEGTVIMFSGCKDDQTSADVQNASAIGAGGACTTALLKALKETDEQSYPRLLVHMYDSIVAGGYTQRPMLSTNKKLDLIGQKFCIPAAAHGRYRALLVGINYVKTPNELSGCQNDVQQMLSFFASKGYTDTECVKVLMDDGEHESPTKDNMVSAMKWLVKGAKAGDTLFFHYSGHGTSVKDTSGDEADGQDEALVPLDFQKSGMLTDDETHAVLVDHVPEGASLTCVCDCCHSGSAMDLPYMYTRDDIAAADPEAAEDQPVQAQRNPLLIAAVALAVPFFLSLLRRLFGM